MGKLVQGIACGLLVAVSFGAQADGQAVYDKHCKGCHVAGVGNAPKPGDKAEWDKRSAAGIDAMVQTVIQGKGAMPKGGTCTDCDEATIKEAVEVLLVQ